MIELSVIIPTRNRSEILSKALDALTLQTFSKNKFEVIVVDNGSTDNTKDVVETYRQQIPNLIYVYDETPGLHVGRHQGFKRAQSDILVYADDDSFGFPTWLETVYVTFQDKDTVLVGGKDLPQYESEPPFWILEKWYRLCEYGHCMPELSLIDFGDEIKEIPPYYVFGCNFAIRKNIVEQAGGFHPDGMPFELIRYRGDGETYVSKYIETHGLKTIYNPKSSIYHLVPTTRMTIDYFKKRAFCQGVEMSYSDLRYGRTNPPAAKRGSRLKRYLKLLMGIECVNRIDELSAKLSLTEIDKQIEQSKQTGYNYHRNMYQKDEALKAWVHKENYWE